MWYELLYESMQKYTLRDKDQELSKYIIFTTFILLQYNFIFSGIYANKIKISFCVSIKIIDYRLFFNTDKSVVLKLFQCFLANTNMPAIFVCKSNAVESGTVNSGSMGAYRKFWQRKPLKIQNRECKLWTMKYAYILLISY